MTPSTKRSIAVLAAAICTLSACRDVAPAFGTNAASARADADDLFGGIGERFTNVQRTPKFTVARRKLGQNALIPSVIYNDTSVWTLMADTTRTLTVDGDFANNRYLFTARPWPNDPATTPGDSRHLIFLRKLKDDQFEWITNVEITAGRITPDQFANVISRLLLSGENRSVADIRADYRTNFPRATAALGRLFSLDSLVASRDGEGATNYFLGIRLNPNGIRKAMPDFAKYLDKYVAPARYRFLVTDKRGAKWIDLRGQDNFMTMRLRSFNGHLAPLDGPVRPLPDEFLLTSDATTKILFFNVGFAKLVGNVTTIDSDLERGWFIRFTKEPDWRLPSVVSFMIHTPLRRPFEGNGSTFRLVLRDNPNGPTIIDRHTTTVVQESAILRFIGKLGATAMGDFVGNSEQEENRFSADFFFALRNDIRALLQ